MIHVPKHFKAEELLPPPIFEKFGREGMRYYRKGILIALDWIQEEYPSRGRRGLIVNNQAHHWRGLRIPTVRDEHDPAKIIVVGSDDWKLGSGHSWGAGVDFEPLDCSPEEVRQWILRTYDQVLRECHFDHPVMKIRRMEIGTPTWVHIDELEHDGPGIQMVSP